MTMICAYNPTTKRALTLGMLCWVDNFDTADRETIIQACRPKVDKAKTQQSFTAYMDTIGEFELMKSADLPEGTKLSKGYWENMIYAKHL